MSIRFYCKCFIAIALAFSCQSKVWAQKQSNLIANRDIEFKNRLSYPWSNAELTNILETSSTPNIIRFSPDGKILASVDSEKISLWDTDNGTIQREFPSHYSSEYDLEIPSTAISFSPDSRFLASSTWSQGFLSPDRSLIVWDIKTGEEVFSLEESEGCRQVLFDPTGEIFYTACGTKVKAWSFPNARQLFSLDLKHPVETMAITSDGKTMAMVDANTTGGTQGEQSNKIQIWSLNETQSKPIGILNGHVNDIVRLEFTPDGERLVSSSYDGKINVWNWKEGKTYQRTNHLHSKDGLFSLSSDGRLIAGNFHSSVMTDLITGLPLRNVMNLSGESKNRLLAFDPQGKLFATVQQSSKAGDRQIYLWQDNAQSQQTSLAIEDNYLSITVAERWNTQKSEMEDKLESDLVKPSAIGKDPQAIALAALGLKETTESEQEQVTIDYDQDKSPVVKIIQTNLADDSVAGIRYLVKFVPYNDNDANMWQVVWAGQQFKCYKGRGHLDWSKDLCN
ncbi:MAG: hypothetical protein AAGE96_14645 [Cyanobacteria bacterium P01_G01_bin.19]